MEHMASVCTVTPPPQTAQRDASSAAKRLALDVYDKTYRRFVTGLFRRPYIEHAKRVMSLVSTCKQVTPDMLSAALCHDVMELKPAMKAVSLVSTVGPGVATLIMEVSMPGRRLAATVPYADRLAVDLQAMASVSTEAKIIILAERLDNILEASKGAPDDWLCRYAQSTQRLLSVIHDVHAVWEDQLSQLASTLVRQCGRVADMG